MIKRLSIEFDIGFSDSELISYEKNENRIKVLLSAWNQKHVCIEFIDVIFFVDYGAWSFSDFCEFIGESSTMLKAIQTQYEEVTSEHSYHLYQFLDNENEPSIEVVAEQISISLV